MRRMDDSLPNVESTLSFRITMRLYDVWHRLNPAFPLYTPGAVRFLDRKLPAGAVVFEWGSGMSTLWYAERANSVIAVEHDSCWWDRVNRLIEERRAEGTQCLFSPPLSPENSRRYNGRLRWTHEALFDRPPDRPEFLHYMSEIDSYPDDSFDLVAVDGRERLGCLIHAETKVKPGGWLLLDDTHRPRYAEAFDLLAGWQLNRFRFGRRETAIFIK